MIVSDNAYDPDVKASQLFIDSKIINKTDCLVFTDDGSGLTGEKLYRMLRYEAFFERLNFLQTDNSYYNIHADIHLYYRVER